MRDQLPKKPRTNECGIVNLDNSNNSGTHWVAYAKRNDYCEYFDSFGDLKPPLEILRYLQRNKIYYNYNRLQNFNSVKCGHFCINFLENFWN